MTKTPHCSRRKAVSKHLATSNHSTSLFYPLKDEKKSKRTALLTSGPVNAKTASSHCINPSSGAHNSSVCVVPLAVLFAVGRARAAEVVLVVEAA